LSERSGDDIKDMFSKTLKFSHHSAFIKRLFKTALEVAQYIKAHPDISELSGSSFDLSQPLSKETLLESRFSIPYFLAHQIVNNPKLHPFYLVIPSAGVHWKNKKDFSDQDGYLRIPCLQFEKPFVWGRNVLNVLAARANADTLFLDIQVTPDYHRPQPKNGKMRSLMTDRALVKKIERREIRKDLWRDRTRHQVLRFDP
jgi:hypothetical protein